MSKHKYDAAATASSYVGIAADAMHSDQRLAGTGAIRFRNLDVTKLSRLFELDGFHGWSIRG